ncbi:amino acid ABC transporter permease [Microvirga sp. W0021]|uniref:Amino acid ABC transporter permease n=1 Tax=Hohaiivirga grylli TaxID=3133970 RepID=A0ABV0BL12_9HYPH
MFANFDTHVITNNLSYLFLDGMRFTLILTALSTVTGVFLGTLLTLMRLGRWKVLAAFSAGYVNFVRSLPLVLVIFWFFFLVPWIAMWMTGGSRPIPVGAFMSAFITFTLFEAAYFAEIVRAGIQSIPKGQPSAGYALGLRYWQVMGYIVLPQAFRNVLPVLLTQIIALFQDTTLVYVLSATDFLGAADKIAKRDFRQFELYIFVAVVYFLISFAASYAVKRLQKRVAIIH